MRNAVDESKVATGLSPTHRLAATSIQQSARALQDRRSRPDRRFSRDQDRTETSPARHPLKRVFVVLLPLTLCATSAFAWIASATVVRRNYRSWCWQSNCGHSLRCGKALDRNRGRTPYRRL